MEVRKSAAGRKELEKHLKGKRLTRGQALRAKCYECENGYMDGKMPCNIPDCPLYPYNAYVISAQKRKESPGV